MPSPLLHALAAVAYLAVACIVLYASHLPLKQTHTLYLPALLDNCTWIFHEYLPSPWEMEWTSGVASLQADVCGHTDPEKSRAWIEDRDDAVLSHFRFTNSCTSDHIMMVPIEPLVGLTRHPYFCLRGEAYLVDKSYMLPAQALAKAPTARHLLFDVGASLYDEGSGGASQRWIVEQYPGEWDGIWAWEATPLAPADVWHRIPAHLRPVYHWYNIPVNADGNDPLRFIRAVATRADFVVLKIDIDNSPLENAIMAKLLASDDTLALVDELYFEHHVDVAPMWPYWGRIPGTSLADTYALFGELRRRGVVAHSWV